MRFSALFKSFIVFLVIFFCLAPLSSQAFAQKEGSMSAAVATQSSNPDTTKNLHNWTQTVMIEVMSSLSCQLSGIDPMYPDQPCAGLDSKTDKIGFFPQANLEKGELGGAVGGMGNMITFLFTPPIHTTDYFQDLAQNFGIAKNSYAQTAETGTGFDSLRPLLNIWSAFRNIVYLIFVIVFIVIGVAIMLRVKIDPRTVMTVQNQIPKIIIGILLVTFSYAIAGFLIDMMYVSIHVVGNVIVSANNSDLNCDPNNPNSPDCARYMNTRLPTQMTQETNTFSAAGHVGAAGGNAGTGLWSIVYAPSKAIGEIIINFFDPLLEMFSGSFVQYLAGVLPGTGGGGGILSWFTPVGFLNHVFNGAILNPIADVLAKTLHVLFGTLIGTLAFIILSIALLIALFRLWITLLMAYIHILIDVVLAPFWIVGGLLPQSPINASGWLRDLIANLAAFPATIAMFLLGKVFMEALNTNSADMFVPPLIGSRVTSGELGALVGFGIILMTPNVVNMLKAALKAPKLGAGGAIAGGIGAGIGIPVAATRTGIASYMGSKEYVLGEGGNAEKRSLGRVFLGRIFR